MVGACAPLVLVIWTKLASNSGICNQFVDPCAMALHPAQLFCSEKRLPRESLPKTSFGVYDFSEHCCGSRCAAKNDLGKLRFHLLQPFWIPWYCDKQFHPKSFLLASSFTVRSALSS
jgi:hypothetical protein